MSELTELEAETDKFIALSWPASAPLIRNHLSEMQPTAQILTVVPGLPQSLYHHLAVLRDVLSDAAYEARERGPEVGKPEYPDGSYRMQFVVPAGSKVGRMIPEPESDSDPVSADRAGGAGQGRESNSQL